LLALKATVTNVFISNCPEAFIFINHMAVSVEFKTTPFGGNRYKFRSCHNYHCTPSGDRNYVSNNVTDAVIGSDVNDVIDNQHYSLHKYVGLS